MVPKVDVKASIVLALDSAVLIAVIAGHAKDAPFYGLTGWRELLQGIAACVFALGIAAAAAAVRPSVA